MNDDQHRAAIKSLAAELFKLNHATALAADEDERHADRCLALGILFDANPEFVSA
jgi:hypothetical protein